VALGSPSVGDAATHAPEIRRVLACSRVTHLE
jgi:hypothetical protein